MSIEQVKQLRDETGISISDCKKALDQTNGDIEEAKKNKVKFKCLIIMKKLKKWL